jgi:RNase P protein component
MERTISHSDIKTRDHLMVRIINGATKAAVHRDRKKHQSRHHCRDWNKHKEQDT